jgi:hypothetical protein
VGALISYILIVSIYTSYSYKVKRIRIKSNRLIEILILALQIKES